MEMKTIIKAMLCALVLPAVMGCVADKPQQVTLTEALADDAWEKSQWISVADAPVVEGIVQDGTRAADGASWFVTTVSNEKKVTSAKWMTTGLGVYDLYVNGRLIGDEVLKPGFTHYEKTKRSYTYDVTAAIST